MQAGLIVKHCCETIDNLLDAQKPCAYKVGYTHDASFRWHNPMYGYRWEKMKWEKINCHICCIRNNLARIHRGGIDTANEGILECTQCRSCEKPCIICDDDELLHQS